VTEIVTPKQANQKPAVHELSEAVRGGLDDRPEDDETGTNINMPKRRPYMSQADAAKSEPTMPPTVYMAKTMPMSHPACRR
jgi:hypothetical protein